MYSFVSTDELVAFSPVVNSLVTVSLLVCCCRFVFRLLCSVFGSQGKEQELIRDGG